VKSWLTELPIPCWTVGRSNTRGLSFSLTDIMRESAKSLCCNIYRTVFNISWGFPKKRQPGGPTVQRSNIERFRDAD
jgi:hypothetical protein